MNAADRKLLAQQTELSADFIVAALRKDRTKNVKIEWVKLSSGARCVEMSLEGIWWKPAAATLERLFHRSGQAPKVWRGIVRTKTEGFCMHVNYEIRLGFSDTSRVVFFDSFAKNRTRTVIQFHP